MRSAYRLDRGSILPAATTITFIVSQTRNEFRTETLCGGEHPITAIASGRKRSTVSVQWSHIAV
jgi:hypothetical protein